MNIGIDAKPLIKNKTGIGIYVAEILKVLNETDKENKYFLYTPRELSLDFKLNENFEIRQKVTGKVGGVLFLLGLHRRLKKDKIDVYWGTQYYLPKRSKFTKKVKYILTIHDLSIKKLKTVGAFTTTIMQKVFLKKSIENADKIIAISEATKNDIIEFYGINKDKIDVIYNGTSFQNTCNITEEDKKKIVQKFGIKDVPYLFFLSTIEPRKNIGTLIKAFDYIKDKEKKPLKLIIAGGLGWKYGETLDIYNNAKYKDDIIMPGYISKEEKEYLYENTECFVYPSLYEGFGLPILEAMASNALVLTSNNSSLPEVGGDVAFYYNNVLDEKELGEKIIEIMNLTEEEKDERKNKGLEQVKKFSWEKCTKETTRELIALERNALYGREDDKK